MSKQIDMKMLAQAGVIFGHKASRWNPKMAPFIWGQKNGVHLIDVSKTAFQMKRAADFLESIAAEGKPVLWVGTKKAARKSVEEAATKLKDSYVKNRWIGGTLTNFPQVKKSVTKLLHYEDILDKAEKFNYTKKELVTFKKIATRLTDNVGAIKDLTSPIGAIVLVDIKKEDTALREAVSVGVPVVALVDTNSDPSLVDYVIPTNDDAPQAISLIVNYLADAVETGKKQAQEVAKAKKAAQEAARAEQEKAKKDKKEAADSEKKEKVAAKKSTEKKETPKKKPVAEKKSADTAPKKKKA